MLRQLFLDRRLIVDVVTAALVHLASMYQAINQGILFILQHF